jgi:hypothetical protein
MGPLHDETLTLLLNAQAPYYAISDRLRELGEDGLAETVAFWGAMEEELIRPKTASLFYQRVLLLVCKVNVSAEPRPSEFWPSEEDIAMFRMVQPERAKGRALHDG